MGRAILYKRTNAKLLKNSNVARAEHADLIILVVLVNKSLYVDYAVFVGVLGNAIAVGIVKKSEEYLDLIAAVQIWIWHFVLLKMPRPSESESAMLVNHW